jgi:O-antigen ligase
MATRTPIDLTVTDRPRVGDGKPGAAALAAAPAALLAVLLIVATWYQGAFALRHWGPAAILGLALLAAIAAAGGMRAADRPARVALACIWAFAAWTLLSALWAESPGRALEGGGRTLLYAALVTLALATLASPAQARRVGALLVAGVAGIAAVTVVQMLSDGPLQFLAGRLDEPVGYRNATACLFGFAFWPLVAAAARRDPGVALRGLALGGATLMLALAFLTQARGVVLGLALGGVLAIALGPDRVRRAWLALLAIAGVGVASGSLLAPFDGFNDRGDATPTEIAIATDALLILVGVLAIVGVAGALLDRGLRLEGRSRLVAGRAASVALIVVAVAGAGAGLARTGDPIAFVDERFDEFRSLETSAPGETRLSFGGGQRADLWRVSLAELEDRPLTGAGEGSYPFLYYEERRTDRNVSTPHSLAFSVLAELGLVGALLLLGFLAAIATALVVRLRAAERGDRWWAVALASGGVVVLGQAAVDWLWLVPGLMGLGLFALALGVASLPPLGERASSARDAPRWRSRVALAAPLALAALAVTLLYVSDAQVREARAAEGSADRLEAARTAERLNPFALAPRYLQAGALEELGRVGAARRELRGALELEPRNFATLGLLGDLELRAGNPAEARAFYRRALELNPLDSGLRELARRGNG